MKIWQMITDTIWVLMIFALAVGLMYDFYGMAVN